MVGCHVRYSETQQYIQWGYKLGVATHYDPRVERTKGVIMIIRLQLLSVSCFWSSHWWTVMMSFFFRKKRPWLILFPFVRGCVSVSLFQRWFCNFGGVSLPKSFWPTVKHKTFHIARTHPLCRVTQWYIKHHESAKLPWHHNVEQSWSSSWSWWRSGLGWSISMVQKCPVLLFLPKF